MLVERVSRGQVRFLYFSLFPSPFANLYNHTFVRTRLRTALNLSTTALDNHLRPLVLALIAAQYVHTSTEHAESMLGTAEQLAAGLGAQPKNASKAPSNSDPKSKAKASANGVGNAHLRLWIGERALGGFGVSSAYI